MYPVVAERDDQLAQVSFDAPAHERVRREILDGGLNRIRRGQALRILGYRNSSACARFSSARAE